MTANVNLLIEGAYKTAGLFNEDQRIDGYRVTEALDYLNEIIDSFATSPKKIAFYHVLTFNMVAGQREYTLSDLAGSDIVYHRLVRLKYCVLIINGYRYPVDVIDDYDYYCMIYAETAQGRPTGVFFSNDMTGTGTYERSKLVFIKQPDQAYQCEIKGKFVLPTLTLNSDITIIPAYYMKLLRYSLAKELALMYHPQNWTADHEKNLIELKDATFSIADTDLSTRLGTDFLGNRRWYYNNLGVIT
jgi:hypothetical protein